MHINLHQMVQNVYTNTSTKDKANIDQAVLTDDFGSEASVYHEIDCDACGAHIKYDSKTQGIQSNTCPYCGLALAGMERSDSGDESCEAVENSGDGSAEDTIYEAECICGCSVEFDQQTLEAGAITCPVCGVLFSWKMKKTIPLTWMMTNL